MFKRQSAAGLLTLIIIFELAAFTLLSLKDGAFAMEAVLMGSITAVLLIFQYVLLTTLFKGIDRHVLIISNVLAAIGLILQYRLNPDLAFRQLMFFGVGMAIMVIIFAVFKYITAWQKSVWWIMLGCLGLLAMTLALGRTIYGARNWVSIAGFSFQPSEFVKIALVFLCAHCLSHSQRIRDLWMLLVFVVGCMGLLVIQRDLGTALLYGGTVLMMFYVATNNLLLTGIGLGAAAGGAAVAYHLFDHVRIRVAVWQNPWALYDHNGFQIVQGLIAIASGGFWGMGLGLGQSKIIPERESDYIFAVLCEEFGIIVGICVLAFYLVLILRGVHIAMHAANSFHSLLAFGCTAMLTMQSFVIVGGVIKLIPLTGVTLPFVSYGGSSMLCSMALMGILQAVSVRSAMEVTAND